MSLKLINKNKLLCPSCNSPMVPAINLEGGDSTFWMRCSKENCNTFVNTYIPQEHQAEVHTDNHKCVGVFGGYGSGKTSCTTQDDQKHMLSTPNGQTVVGSAILAQVEQTYEKELRQDLPKDFVLYENKSKKTYILINGHTLLIKSFYDEELLRSLNSSRIHIVEASAIDHEIFIQLKARLRSLAGAVLELDSEGNVIYDPSTDTFKTKVDWKRIFIESNPSNGWIRDDYLFHSSVIKTYDTNQYYNVLEPDRFYSSHIHPTKLNAYLPSDFIESNSKNKPLWWIRRYLQGSFDYAEGMVYSNIYSCFVDDFLIPTSWHRVISTDYGINDPSAWLYGAIDPVSGILYIFDETYVTDNNYETQSDIYWQKFPINIPLGKLWTPPIMDGRSINKRNDFNLKTIGDLFAERKIFLQAAMMDLEARMLKTNTFIDSGKLKIFKSCINLYKEGINYKFPPRTADGKSQGDKPVDKNNHAVNAMEFMIMTIPENLKNLEHKSYDARGIELKVLKKIQNNDINPYTLYEDTNKSSSQDSRFGSMYGGWERENY